MIDVINNPLSPKNDHQISPCNMNALQNKLVMRIKYIMTQDESLILQQILPFTSLGNVYRGNK